MSAARHCLRSYALMVEWHVRKLRPWLLPVFLFQLVIGVGAAVGLGFLLPHVTPRSALYLSTGAPTTMLLGLGLAVVPAAVTRARDAGVIDYMMSLPVPRLAYLLGDLTVWCALALPGTALSVWIAARRYGLELHPEASIVPVVLLTAVSATAVGYAYALASPSPMVTSVVSNLLLLCVFLLSPVDFPVERLPDALAMAHRVLPIEAAAGSMRAALQGAGGAAMPRDAGVLAAWTIGGLVLAHRMMSRRG